MKKHVATLCAVILALVAGLTNLVGCSLDVVPTGIAIVGGYESSYFVGDVFDYDSVQILVSYDDGSSETKTAKELGATHIAADMSTSGVKTVQFDYKGFNASINFTVVDNGSAVEVFDGEIETFSVPEFYANYLTVSSKNGNTDADFKVLNRVYEVGTDNKFLFRPVITGFDADDKMFSSNSFVKTTARLFVKEAADLEYAEITDAEELSAIVTVDDNNGYSFSEDHIGKFVRLEVSLDETYYTQVSSTIPSTTIACEFQIVNGYNVYDQMGLSVMDDIVTSWAPLKQITLEADSKMLVEYTDVTNVIIHGSITLDPNLFPEEYFYFESTPGYDTVKDTFLAANTVGLQDKLNGSLRDHNIENVTGDGTSVGGYVLSDGGQHVNGQKGLFTTSKCSISGNYNSIRVITEDSGDMTPEEYKAKYGNRNLYTIYSNGATGDTAGINNPVSHWSLFKFFKKDYNTNPDDAEMSIKNLSCSGSMGHVESNGRPAGLMMVNSYIDGLTVDNVIGDRFYTNFVCDGAGDDSEDSKVKSITNISNTKLINAYSNMIYTWRGTVNVSNSILRDAGGPLFLLVDGTRQAAIGDQGCILTVDAESELSSFATGTESWYAQWGAGALLNGLKSMDALLNGYFNKTIQYAKNSEGVAVPWDGKTATTYLNVIGVMITNPSTIMSSHDPEYLCAGEFKNLDADGKVLNDFVMRSALMDIVNAQNTVLFQSGANCALMGPSNNLLSATTFGELSASQQEVLAWRTNSTNLLCTYMRAGIGVGSKTMPYFGAVLGFNNIAA